MVIDKGKDVEVYPALEPTEDKVYRLAEAATSVIPAGQQLLHSLISSPIQKRMEAWIHQTEEKIKTLEAEGKLDFNELESRPEFSALLLRTIQAAAVTSQDEQLAHLRNFIINISLKPEISEDEAFIILEIIKDFTPSHVRVLHFYDSPTNYEKEIVELQQAITMRTVKSLDIPEGQELAAAFGYGEPEYWFNIFRIVHSKHLIEDINTPIDPKSPDPIVQGRSTEFGKKVLSMLMEAE